MRSRPRSARTASTCSGSSQQLRSLEQRARDESAKALPLFEKRGQLLPRERVARLLDSGTPMLALCTLSGYLQDVPDPAQSIAGSGAIAGIGYVSGTRVMVVADDAGIDAGALQAGGLDKLLRAQTIALENRLPFVHLVESAGANLLKYRVEHFVRGGEIFANLARLSAAGLPVVSVVHGSSTAGGAYMTGLADYVVMVRGRAKAFLAGPPLLKAATGEEATDEELGGAELHASVSGLAEYVAENDADALRITRELIASLGWSRDELPLRERSRAELRRRRVARPVPPRPEEADRHARSHRARRRRLEVPRLQAGPRPGHRVRPCRGARACRSASSRTTARSTRRAARRSTHFIQSCCQSRLPIV